MRETGFLNRPGYVVYLPHDYDWQKSTKTLSSQSIAIATQQKKFNTRTQKTKAIWQP